MAAAAVRLDGNTLLLGGGVRVRFIRTLRLPESGTHPLPPGLGEFPVRRVEDFAATVPPAWRARGGVLVPMYLREALWLSFAGSPEPAALQVGVGKVCAVSGRPWSGTLGRDPQNYVVLPRQPWLDGINSGRGTVRQFVAVPLGLGATVEGQVTGEETWGGVQLQAFPLDGPARDAWRAEQEESARRAAAAPAWGGPAPYPPGAPPAPMAAFGGGFGAAPGAPAPYAAPAPGAPAARAAAPRRAVAMGLGAGGAMRQEVYRDDRPLSDWAPEPAGRVFVHLVTPPEWRRITGEEPPPSPVDRDAYTRAGLPWYDYDDASATDLPPAGPPSGVKPVGDWLGDDHAPWTPPGQHQVQPLGDAAPPGKPVGDGDW
ncbi:hypothetical protein [Streptomyces roseolilacinus]|uniref:hypothetical protein n=1 Tax=Streptomyces roseolilacinus TaxID=66904 RepID=UPI00382CEF4E